MNDWERLGIDPTSDASMIKKAYAKQLKLNRPEDDPQGYQELREAYERLLKYVKNNALYSNIETLQNPEDTKNVETLKYEGKEENNSEVHINYNQENSDHGSQNPTSSYHMMNYKLYQNVETLKDEDNEESNWETHFNFNQEDPEPEVQNLNLRPDSHSMSNNDVDCEISKFFDKVLELYHDFYQRLELRYWEELLNNVIIWNLDAKEIVNRSMLEFLSRNFLLPRDIWKFLNRYFEWSTQEEYIRNTYNRAFAEYLFLQIGNERVPRYCYFDRRLNINYEEYVYYRESAFMALLNCELNSADTYLNKAAELFSGDPDLFCLWGELCIRTKDYQRAEYEFQAALAINSNDIYIYYYIANVYYNAALYMKALKIYNMINNSGQYNYELMTLIGKCYLKMCKFKKAKKIFLDNLRINPSDSELKECLEQISQNSHLGTGRLVAKRIMIVILILLGLILIATPVTNIRGKIIIVGLLGGLLTKASRRKR